MTNLTKFQMAAIKRTAQNIKGLRAKLNKSEAIINAKMIEVQELQKQIDLWEAPIKEITGGFTSEEVLSGAMDMSLEVDNTEVIDYEEKAPEVEVVPTEETNPANWGVNLL